MTKVRFTEDGSAPAVHLSDTGSPRGYGDDGDPVRLTSSSGLAIRLVDGPGDAADYQSAVRAMSPVAYWRLGEAAGTVAADAVGTNPGTYVGAPTLGVAGATTDGNKAVTFNGTTQYATVSVPSLVAGDFSFSAWIKMVSNAFVGIIGSATGGPIALVVNGHLRLSCAWTADGPDDSRTIATGVWAHVAIVYRLASHEATYVINGAASAPVTFAPAWGGAPVGSIGAYDAVGNSSFNGTIDEVAIWNRALSAAEVASLYAAR